jgi:hypothetical protein
MKIVFLLLFPISFIYGQTVNDLIIKEINLYREQFGIHKLKYAPEAELANQQMLNYMIENYIKKKE